MLKKIAFIVYYNKSNIFSLNALIAAIETNNETKETKFYYIREKRKLFVELKKILSA